LLKLLENVSIAEKLSYTHQLPSPSWHCVFLYIIGCVTGKVSSPQKPVLFIAKVYILEQMVDNAERMPGRWQLTLNHQEISR